VLLHERSAQAGPSESFLKRLAGAIPRAGGAHAYLTRASPRGETCTARTPSAARNAASFGPRPECVLFVPRRLRGRSKLQPRSFLICPRPSSSPLRKSLHPRQKPAPPSPPPAPPGRCRRSGTGVIRKDPTCRDSPIVGLGRRVAAQRTLSRLKEKYRSGENEAHPKREAGEESKILHISPPYGG